MVMHSQGREEEALALLLSQFDEISEILGSEVVAQAAAWMGQTELAFEALEARYGAENYKHFILTWNDPVYDSIRDDPRWPVLLGKVNLTAEQRAAIIYNPVLPD
jgi:hypothetical protein